MSDLKCEIFLDKTIHLENLGCEPLILVGQKRVGKQKKYEQNKGLLFTEVICV